MGLGDIKKIEADKLGYRLVRKTEYVNFIPCICGASNRGRWSSPDGIFFECNNCLRGMLKNPKRFRKLPTLYFKQIIGIEEE